MAHRRFGAFYARSFEKRPWLTLAIANGTLGALSDILAQTFEKVQSKRSSIPPYSSPSSTTGNPPVSTSTTPLSSSSSPITRRTVDWDIGRTSRFLGFGIMMAPVLAEWNKFVEIGFPLRSGVGNKVSLVALGKRVGVDQGLFAPFGLICFVGAMGVMEGRGWSSLKEKYSQVYLPALIANWKLWPLVQTINFRFLPLKYRVPFTGAVGIGWQVFLSILNSANKKKEVNK